MSYRRAMERGVLLVCMVGGCLSRAPTSEIQQVYYLGVFDPLEQVPPTVYRVTVHGQASAISAMRFASGWVPAHLIDSLQSRVTQDMDSGDVGVSGGENLSRIKTGRRLIQFGPEGFREAVTSFVLEG